MSLIYTLIIGAIIGWLAGVVFKGSGFGLIVDILVGIVGTWIGSWLYGQLGFTSYGLLGQILMGVIGAVLLLWVLSLIRGRG